MSVSNSLNSIRQNASFIVVLLAIGITAVALVVATASLVLRMK